MSSFSEKCDIEVLREAFEQASDQLQPFERGVDALVALFESDLKTQREMSAFYESKAESGILSIFTKIPVSALTKRMIKKLHKDKDLFSLPLLRAGATAAGLKHMERLMGKSEEASIQMAHAVMEHLEHITTFPLEPVRALSTPVWLADINRLIVQLESTAKKSNWWRKLIRSIRGY